MEGINIDVNALNAHQQQLDAEQLGLQDDKPPPDANPKSAMDAGADQEDEAIEGSSKHSQTLSKYRQCNIEPTEEDVFVPPTTAFLEDEKGAKGAGGRLYTRWKTARFMEQSRVRGFFMFLVIINGILIGIQLDYGGSQTAWSVVDMCFLFVFLIEVGTRLFAFSTIFFTDPWNCLDFTVVAAGIVDAIVSTASGNDPNAAFTVFRLIRIFRIIRIMGFFDRLSKLVEAFFGNNKWALWVCGLEAFGAMKDVIWVGVLVILMLYIFGVMVTTFYGDKSKLNAAGFESDEYFGTVPKSMATLFQIMTMDSWMSGITRPVGMVYGSAWFVLITWAIVGALGLLNLLTAIFIESLTEITKQADHKHKTLQKKRRERVLAIIQRLFKDFDTDRSGTLDVEEANLVLKEIEQRPDIIEAFRDLGITGPQINEALVIADLDGDGIEYHEFIECLNIMDSNAQKKDTMMLAKQVAMLSNQVSELTQEVKLLRGMTETAEEEEESEEVAEEADEM